MIQFNHNFHIFIKRVIELFKDQRSREKYQFAVLFLTSQQDITTTGFYKMTQTMFSRTRLEVNSPGTATDKTCSTHPPDRDLCNYVVARPDGRKHAEALLMNKLDTLLRQYQSVGMPECQTVVLYTWLLPCDSCADTIIRKLGQEGQRLRVILIYTSKVREVTENHACTIISKLEAAGITVRQEIYDSVMYPA